MCRSLDPFHTVPSKPTRDTAMCTWSLSWRTITHGCAPYPIRSARCWPMPDHSRSDRVRSSGAQRSEQCHTLRTTFGRALCAWVNWRAHPAPSPWLRTGTVPAMTFPPAINAPRSLRYSCTVCVPGPCRYRANPPASAPRVIFAITPHHHRPPATNHISTTAPRAHARLHGVHLLGCTGAHLRLIFSRASPVRLTR